MEEERPSWHTFVDLVARLNAARVEAGLRARERGERGGPHPLWPVRWKYHDEPLPAILRKKLPAKWTLQDMSDRLEALFTHYGFPFSPEKTNDSYLATAMWEAMVWCLAIQHVPGFQESRPRGAPRKSDFTDRDAIIWYELGLAEYERLFDRSKPTVNAKARTVAKLLGEDDPVKIKNRYQALWRRTKGVQAAMEARGFELAQQRKAQTYANSGEKFQS